MGDPADRLTHTGRTFLALGISNYGAMAVGLAVNVVLARRLGTEGYGRLAVMLMPSQVLLLMTVNWTYTGFVRFASQEFASTRLVNETLSARLGIVVPTALAGILLLVIGREPFAAYLDVPPAAVWLIALHFAAVSALSLMGAVFQARDQMARYGLCLLLDKAVMLVCVLVLPAAWTANPMIVVGGYTASSVAVALWGIALVGPRALRPVVPRRSTLRHLALFSTPVLLSSWTGLLGANWFDLVILKWYVPVSDIGRYSLATQLAGVVQQITIIFSTLVLPPLSVMVAEGRDARIRMLVERLLPYWMLGTSVLFSLVVLGARIGVPLAFGPSFSGAAPVLIVLMGATSALALYNSCAPLVAAYGSMWSMSGIGLVSAAANVALDLLLIPPFGLIGSAFATVVAYGTSAVLVLLFVQGKLGARVLRLPWLSAPVVVACVCGLALDGVWLYAVAPVAIAVTVFALIAAFRLFQTDDAIFLKDLRLPASFGVRAS